MKKTIYLFLALGFGVCSFAQTKPAITKKVLPKPNTAALIANTAIVEVFENNGFHGKSFKLFNNTDPLNLPFTPERISIKIAAGYIAYIKTACAEFPSENAYYGNVVTLEIPQREICGIRFAKAYPLNVSFNGISTNVHNNDCKKMYGTVKISVLVKNSEGQYVNSPRKNNRRPGYSLLYNVAKNTDNQNSRESNNFIFNNNPLPHLFATATLGGGRKEDVFYIDQQAIENDLVLIEVKSELGSAHKMSDLACDFNWDAKMAKEETFTINPKNLPRTPAGGQSSELITIPYDAYSGRGSCPEATGGPGTLHQYRVHFTLGLPIIY